MHKRQQQLIQLLKDLNQITTSAVSYVQNKIAENASLSVAAANKSTIVKSIPATVGDVTSRFKLH